MSDSFRTRSRPRGDGRLPMWFGPVFALLGIVAIPLSILGWQNAVALAERGIQADGVVDRLRVSTSDDSTSYVLTYAFAAADGTRYGGSTSISRSRFEASHVGDPVTVTYLPDAPGTNTLGIAEPPSAAAIAVVLVGAGVFIVSGALVKVTAVRQRRPGAVTAADPEAAFTPGLATAPGPRFDPPAPVATSEFRRPISRIAVDLLGPPFTAAMFLGVAWFIGFQAPDVAMTTRAFVVVMFGFFGILAALSSVVSIRRGLRRTVLGVGPSGIWTPEAGRLAWSDIAQVSLESLAAPSGVSRGSPGSRLLRLGIVPRDPERGRADVASGAVWALSSMFVSLSRRVGPRTGIRDDLSRIGVWAYELDGGLGPAIAAVRGFVPVVDRTSSGEIRAAVAAAVAAPTTDADRALTGPELRDLDAALAPGALPGLRPTRPVMPSLPSLPPPPTLVATPATAPRAAASRRFRPPSGLLSERPFGRLSDVWKAGRDALIALLVLAAGVIVVANLAASRAVPLVVITGVVFVPVLIWAVLTLLELPSRLGRLFADDDTSLEVGPAGIWFPDAVRLAWGDIDSIRIEGSSSGGDSDDEETEPSWRIIVRPRDAHRLEDRSAALLLRDRLRAGIGRVPFLSSWRLAPGFSVTSDRLDAPIEDVIDLIAAYHAVETD